MRMVPVVLGGDVLLAIVGVLQVIGRAEFLDGLFDASGAPQLVAAHVVGVGNGAGQSQVGFALLERSVGAADLLESMRKVMVRGGSIRRDDTLGGVKAEGV